MECNLKRERRARRRETPLHTQNLHYIVIRFKFENAINIDFSKTKTDLQKICIENHDLAYKMVNLKIKSKAPDQIYFMSQVFQEHSPCYDKKKK